MQQAGQLRGEKFEDRGQGRRQAKQSDAQVRGVRPEGEQAKQCLRVRQTGDQAPSDSTELRIDEVRHVMEKDKLAGT